MGTLASSSTFLADDFLLTSEFARTLYHEHAKKLPIIDYHCHLSPADIAKNRQFENLTRIWLEGDHYKWRAMRTLGINEAYITGKGSDREKFEKWSYTVPYTLRNPLYHWTHLELKRYFGIHQLLNPETAASIYDEASRRLKEPEFSARGILSKMNVELVCTTDDPVDSLEGHQQIRSEAFTTDVRPAFRPDKAYAIENPAYTDYVAALSAASGIQIKSYDDLLQALRNRMDYFEAQGCQLSDHGLEYIPACNPGEKNVEKLFTAAMAKAPVSREESDYFKFHTLLELARMYHAKNWTQQFHLGAIRNTNSRMMKALGPDTGFDSIGDYPQGVALAKFLNLLDTSDQLAKTILYNLNPADNEVIATLIGNFNDGSVKGKMQFGAAWWFLDQKDGMEKQINALSNLGLLSCFIGMLTDSRSFMSFPRHEYFRRVLCNLIGHDVQNGELPADEKWLGKVVADICHHNAKAFLNFSNR